MAAAAAAQVPSPGRIVRYRLTADQAAKTNARREDAKRNADKMRKDKPGFQAHIGNTCAEGDVYPMIIVVAHPDGKINGQTFLDGNDVLWVSNAEIGDTPGSWAWPPRA